jgi:hypothetical protein
MFPDRVYVIIGSLREPYTEPSYSTDPRPYGLPLIKAPVPDDEFEREYRDRVKAFNNPDDAMQFASCCHLMSAMFLVFDRVGEAWMENDAEATRVALGC